MQKLFYLNCLLKNIGIRLSCHQNSQLNHSLALVNKNNEIVFLHLYDKAEPEIKCVPWITLTHKRIAAICLNPTSDWLLIITEDNSLYVVPTFRSTEKEHKKYPKWSTSDVSTIIEDVPYTNNQTKPLKLLWWQRKNSNQNAFIGYEDGTIRLVCLENGCCLDTCKVADQIRSLNLCPNQSRDRISLLIQGESGQKWSSILERQFIGSVWQEDVNCRKPLRFQPLELVNEDMPEFSPFKCCVICAITEEFNSLISKSSKCNYNSGELDLSVDILQAHFNFAKNERVLHIYKIMDSDYFNDKNYKVTSSGVQPNFFPSLIENFKLSESPIEGYLVVTDIGVYKISLSCFVIDKVISLVMNDKFGLAAKFAIVFGLNLIKLLESCGDLMIVHDSIPEGLKMYRFAKINPLTKISKIANNTEVLIKFCRIYLTTNKNTMATTDKICVTNVIVMAYLQIISNPDEELKYKKFEGDFLNFIRHEDLYDGSLILGITCKFRLWNIASLIAVTHGFQNELVAALIQTITDPPPLKDTNFCMILSDPDLTLSLLVQPESCNAILKFVRKNLKNLPLEILLRFVNQLDSSKICNVFEMTIEDQKDHRRKMIETFILLVMQLVDQTKTSCSSYNPNLFQKLPPDEASNTQNLNQFCNFSTLSCGYKYAAVIRNDQIYTMGDSTSGSLGVGPTAKQNNPPKVCKTLDALNAVVWSVSCGRKHTLALTDSGVFSWGSNAYGQLGISALNRKSPYPTIVSSLKDEQIVAVVAGQYHSMVLTASGLVYTWGWGIHGQLGHGSSNNEYIPRLLNFNHSVVKIAAGYAHSLILTSEGKLYGFGSNTFGQLAKKNLYGNKSSVPIQIVVLCNTFTSFRDISAGYFQSVAIRDKDEVLYAWGTTPKYLRSRRSKSAKNPQSRPLKRGRSPTCINISSSTIPIKQIVVGLHHIVMLRCGILHVCKDMEETFTMVKTNEQNNCGKFTSVSCGSDFTLARSKTGRLFFWGNEIVAKTLMGKSYDNTQEERARLSNRFQSHLGSNPEEIRGLPSIVITYHPVGHSFKSPKSVLKSSCKFDQETLLLILETYFGHYDTQNMIGECLEINNLQAASKIAILNNQFEDSFGYQLRIMESGKLVKFSFAELREDLTTESWKILMNLVEFYIEFTVSLECKIHIKNIINMCFEFWINNELPVTTFENILLKNIDKLSNTLFNIIFCEHSSNNFQEEMNENEDDDKKLRNHKLSQFLNSLSSKFKLQLCSSIIKYVDH